MPARAKFVSKPSNAITFEHTCADGHAIHIVADSYLDLVTKLTPYLTTDSCSDACARPNRWAIGDSRSFPDGSALA